MLHKKAKPARIQPRVVLARPDKLYHWQDGKLVEYADKPIVPPTKPQAHEPL